MKDIIVLAHIIDTLVILFLLIAPLFCAYILAKRSKNLFVKILYFVLAILIIIAVPSSHVVYKYGLINKKIWVTFFSIYLHICFFSYGVGAIIYKQRMKKLKIRFIIMVILIQFLFFTLWRESYIVTSASVGCVSTMMSICNAIEDYSQNHNGFLPTQITLKEFWPHREKPIKCPLSDVPYEWTKKQYTIDDNPNLMIVWDGKPHGFIFNWRVVIFTEKEEKIDIRFISEKDFQKLLKEQQGKSILENTK